MKKGKVIALRVSGEMYEDIQRIAGGRIGEFLRGVISEKIQKERDETNQFGKMISQISDTQKMVSVIQDMLWRISDILESFIQDFTYLSSLIQLYYLAQVGEEKFLEMRNKAEQKMRKKLEQKEVK